METKISEAINPPSISEVTPFVLLLSSCLLMRSISVCLQNSLPSTNTNVSQTPSKCFIIVSLKAELSLVKKEFSLHRIWNDVFAFVIVSSLFLHFTPSMKMSWNPSVALSPSFSATDVGLLVYSRCNVSMSSCRIKYLERGEQKQW